VLLNESFGSDFACLLALTFDCSGSERTNGQTNTILGAVRFIYFTSNLGLDFTTWARARRMNEYSWLGLA